MKSWNRIAIVGSREGIDPRTVRRFVDWLATHRPDCTVISGGARGVDTWAIDQAQWRGLKTKVFPADWETHGRSAGFKRNRTIVENADVVVAYTTGSKGTAHTIQLAKEMGRIVRVCDQRGTLIYKSNGEEL